MPYGIGQGHPEEMGNEKILGNVCAVDTLVVVGGIVLVRPDRAAIENCQLG